MEVSVTAEEVETGDLLALVNKMLVEQLRTAMQEREENLILYGPDPVTAALFPCSY